MSNWSNFLKPGDPYELLRRIERLPDDIANCAKYEAPGELGRRLYQAAAATMMTRHAGSTVHLLSRPHLQYIKPILGDWVMRVEIVYQARLMDYIGSYQGKSIYLTPPDVQASAGQTFGYRVYIASSPSPSLEMTGLLLHELIHVVQYRKYGESLSNFGYHYFKGWAKAGCSYDDNPMELEAHTIEENFLEDPRGYVQAVTAARMKDRPIPPVYRVGALAIPSV